MDLAGLDRDALPRAPAGLDQPGGDVRTEYLVEVGGLGGLVFHDLLDGHVDGRGLGEGVVGLLLHTRLLRTRNAVITRISSGPGRVKTARKGFPATVPSPSHRPSGKLWRAAKSSAA